MTDLWDRSTLMRNYECTNAMRHFELGKLTGVRHIFTLAGHPGFPPTAKCPICGTECEGASVAHRVWTTLEPVGEGGMRTEFHSEEVALSGPT